ncbi:MAG: adenylate/guanylate cyclase domain-containing protein [Candidatus Eremiobacteraeota bacterium]|nr:adenylate/guanylate cyclase domain-containing protein [Candidatus Eremiobacteraeota bacterium]
MRDWLAVFVPVGLLLLAGQLWLAPWDARLTDGWFVEVGQHLEIDERIRLVEVDDRSLSDLKAPVSFWAPHFANTCAALLQARAAAVGLDWIPYEMDQSVFDSLREHFHELGTVGENPWVPLLLASQERQGSFLVQGIYPTNLQSHLSAPPASQAQNGPTQEVLSIVGTRQLAFLNLSRDADGILRSQTVVPVKLQEPLWGASAFAPFAARLAEVALGQDIDPSHPDPVFNLRPLPLDRHGRIRVLYPAPGRVPHFSLSQILAWRRDKARLRREFEGKIVLIGPGTKLFQDLVSTPVGEIYGVEAHAATLNALLTGAWVKKLPPAWDWTLLLLAVGVGGGLGLWLSTAFSLPVLLLIEGCVYAGCRGLFQARHVLLPVLPLLVGLAVAWALAAALRARRQTHRENYVRQLFGRYVSPAVMQVLLRDPGQTALGAVSRRRITVLFSDINGFSGHCEKKTPEQIMGMLNQYFEHMNRILFRHGGTIKQFVGDEIMAMFGAPLEHPQAEEAAVLAAVEMMRHLTSLRAADPQEDHGFYHIKVGIHSGDVILGNVGSLERTEYAAVGDDVNLGSRIMNMTRNLGGDILISQEVYQKVKHLPGMSFVPKGAHPVKGRVEPVEIYQVVPE